MDDEFQVECFNNVYEIGNFLKFHPGGLNYVKNFRNRVVERRMAETEHSRTAYYLLREYNRPDRDIAARINDEDLERLVDWSKPMLSQVGKLRSKYAEWVTLPVDRELRLFGNCILEGLTKTPWYLVLVIWLPVIVLFLYLGFNQFEDDMSFTTQVTRTLTLLGLGATIWTLMEYTIHRWVFHRMPSGLNKSLIVFHFITHGLHHKVPFDHMRLVFPPFPAAIVSCIVYAIYSKLFPDSMRYMIAAGTLLGYVTYDMIHFYLHYGAPKENTFLYNMKRYHNQHHFVHQDSGFGISNKAWDYCFGTLIKLKKLKMPIKWS